MHAKVEKNKNNFLYLSFVLFFMHCTAEWMNLEVIDPCGEKPVLLVSPHLLYTHPTFHDGTKSLL